MSHAAAYFDAKFEASSDPWRYETSWYEQRKRDLTMAALPRRRYARAYEPACANGVLSDTLAHRCDRLLCSDGAPHAVDLARRRLASRSHVEVLHAWMPHDWPEGSFDLIVISELGYFLSREDLQTLLQRSLDALRPDGTLLACHWRHQARDCEWNGNDVHRLMDRTVTLPQIGHWLDEDFVLDVWSRDGRSVATREGLAT